MLKKHKIGSFIGLIFIISAVGIVIWCCYCISLAFHDDYKDKYTITETDDTLTSSVIKSAIFGEEFDITETQVNTYINQKITSENSDKNNTVEKIAVYFHENQPSELYAKIKWLGYDFGFYAKLTINLDTSNNTIYTTISDAKLGRLNIPDKILAKTLSETLQYNSDITVSGTTVAVKSDYNYKIKNTDILISLEEFTPHEHFASCRTNNLSIEALNALKKYIQSDEGKEQIKEFFDLDNIKDNISSWVKKLQ